MRIVLVVPCPQSSKVRIRVAINVESLAWVEYESFCQRSFLMTPNLFKGICVTVLENGCIVHIGELQKKYLGGCVQDTEAF
jgi:hypothetical protein